MHKMVLLKEEVTRLREANQILSQRRRAKKKDVCAMEDIFLYRMHRFRSLRKMWSGSCGKKNVLIVVARNGSKRAKGAVDAATTPAITHVHVK